MVAYVDKLVVGQGGSCGVNAQGICNPNLWMIGHCDDGNAPAFRAFLWDESGELHGDTLVTSVFNGFYRWAGGLLPQHCDGVLPLSRKNTGPPWRYGDYMIYTGGAGGYSLGQYFDMTDLHRGRDVTWHIQVVASPCELEITPDGYPLRLICLEDWNWPGLTVNLHIYYDGRIYRCDEASVGEFPSITPPVISGVNIEVLDDKDPKRYARVIVSFKTDVETEAQVYYGLEYQSIVEGKLQAECDPYSVGGWCSGVSMGTSHVIELSGGSLYYSDQATKHYCLQIVACLPKYRYVDWGKAKSDTHRFDLPSKLEFAVSA